MKKKPAWVAWLEAKVGLAEFKGTPDNPEIVAMFARIGLTGGAWTQDETPWCAAAVGAALEATGITSTRSARARSYERWAHGARVNAAVFGAVAVLDRAPPHPDLGHVGFVVGANPSHVALLGGNQNDAVNVTRFPMFRVRGFYWPLGVLIEPEWIVPPMPGGAAQAGCVV